MADVTALRAPTPAELARTAVAGARVATLAAGRCARPTLVTVVAVVDDADGQPVIRLERTAPVVRLLSMRPVVRLAMPATYPFSALSLAGRLEDCPSDREQCRAFRLSVLGARLLGESEVPIPLTDYRAARPDPLWGR